MSKTHTHKHRRPLFHRRTRPGASPGSVVVDPKAPKPIVRLMAYDNDKVVERELRTAADFKHVAQHLERFPVTWIHVEGLGDADIVRRIGEIFSLHKLALEDVVNNHQRSKVEQYGDHLFIVARILEGGTTLASDQMSLFLGKNFVITFQHMVGDCLDPVRERIRQARGVIRDSRPDYLAYAILDCTVDSYFPILEAFGDHIESLEEALIDGADDQMVSRIHTVKTKLLAMRRAIWPLREALHVLVRDPDPLISDDTRIYLRDCADHTFQIIDLVETYRELSSNLMDLYHTSLANRTNEIMQVLTVIATIFIPLTFIVGVYGMNFDMPELKWRHGYTVVWCVMLAVALSLVGLCSRMCWLPKRTSRQPPGTVPGHHHPPGNGKPLM